MNINMRLLPLLLATGFGAALAAPTQPTVAAGQATFAQQGNVFSITNTPNTIINWQTFSIAPGEVTRFIQQGPNSAVLNRILGQDPSQILGALQSNGKVYLINPNGILFGKDARIDVNGLTASTLNLTNADFLAGKRQFTAGDTAGGVVNQGAIRTPSGGQVLLVAPNVENSGVIQSPQGEVLLAAGRSVQLVDSADPDVHVVVSAPADRALNLGQVVAQGGRVGIYGALINQRGLVSADSAVVGENGRIVFKSSGDTLLEAGSRTSATGAGTGGTVQVLGQRVGLMGDASVDASAAAGGGTVLIGGDAHGANAAVPNAQRTYVGAGATIRADATGNGNGGKVIVWSDLATQAYGRVTARGGASGGNGGFIETSGNALDVAGIRIDAGAPRGALGRWLLDPLNIEVVNGGGGLLTDADAFATNATSTVSLAPNTLSSANAAVLLQAKNDITFTDAVSNTINNSNISLTAQAGGNININGALNWATGAEVHLTANDPGGTQTGTGTVNVNAALTTGAAGIFLKGAGVSVGANGSVVAGSGIVNIATDTLTLTGALTSTNNVYLAPATNGRSILVAANKSASSLSLTPTELASITAGQLYLGDTANTGNITFTDAVSVPLAKYALLSVRSGGTIALNNALTLDAGQGLLMLQANGSISQNASYGVGANQMMASAVGSVDMQGPNAIPNIAGGSGNGSSFKFTNTTATAISLISDVNGLGAGTIIQLTSGGDISQVAGTLIQADTLKLIMTAANGGTVALNNTGNAVNKLTAKDTNSLSFWNSQSLTLGDGTDGITSKAGANMPPVSIFAQNAVAPATLTVQQPVLAGSGTAYLYGDNLTIGGVGSVSGGTVQLSTAKQGVLTLVSGAHVTSTGGISLVADQMSIASGATISATNGTTRINPATSDGSHLVTLGAGATDAANTLGLTQTEMAAFNVKSFIIANTTDGSYGTVSITSGGLDLSGIPSLTSTSLQGYAGGIVVNGPFKVPGALTLSGGTSITGAGLVTAPSLTLTATRGIGSSAQALNIGASTLSATNTDNAITAEPIHITANASAPTMLTLNSALQNGTYKGDITIDAYGGLTIPANGHVSTGTGAIKLTTHSPFDVYGLIDTTSGPINLYAGGSGSLSIYNGASVTSTSGNITLQAEDLLTVSGTVTTTGQILRQGSLNPPGPTLTDCIANPSLTGCDTVLPSLTTCIASPTTLGCSVVLPALTTCISSPTTAGCSVVLPTLSQCVATPTLQGCSVVLPSLATCISSPTTAGCSVVLPSLATCIATPTTAGCSVVLPSLATCTANPSVAGCSVVLPSLASCIANPNLAGCSAILPSLATCIAAPTTAGCSVVLPSIAACVANPTAAGCSVVLPTLTQCIATPTAPGCSVVLPTLAQCIASPTLTGCSVILPTLAQCTTNPTLPGCAVVLPTLAQCVAAPTRAGCSVVLPTLAECTSSPSLPGCAVVLPPLSQCAANPNAAGCTAVLPNVDTCTTNPNLEGCVAILPTSPTPAARPVTGAIGDAINIINTSVWPLVSTSGSPGSTTPASTPSGGGGGKGTTVAANEAGVKKDEKTPKLYCN